MHFFVCFFCKRYGIKAHRFKLTAHPRLLALKWNAQIKIKLSRPALGRSWGQYGLQVTALSSEVPPCSVSLRSKPRLQEGASFIWCGAVLLCLLALGCCCTFLGAVFGRVLCGSGGGGVGGFGGLHGFWGRVGRMSPAPPFIPGWGRVTPPASLLSHRRLRTHRREGGQPCKSSTASL